MSVRALLVDDDDRLSSLLASYLEPHGVSVERARDGLEGLSRLSRETFDVVLLDLTMPKLDGLEVCRRVRATSRIPILMLTARGDETDRVVGLELGADDYLPKPFSPRELLARIRAVLRRAQPEVLAERIVVAGLVLDLGSRRVSVDGRDVELTGLEFDLLAALARRAGRVVPRETLLELAGRGDVNVSERTVDVHVSHLRQKIGDDPRAPRRIRTVRGVGYVLAKDEG